MEVLFWYVLLSLSCFSFVRNYRIQEGVGDIFLSTLRRGKSKTMAAQSEVEELQLQLEWKICSLDLNGLVELAAHLNVESKELGKLALSKKIREEVENSLTETEDKKVYLVGLLAFVNGKPPPLEGDATANKEQVKVKHESLNQLVRNTEGEN